MLTDKELARRKDALINGTPYQAALRAADRTADRRRTASTDGERRASDEVVTLEQSGFALGWILCWVIACFAGAVFIGENLAQRVLPWSSPEALEGYSVAPMCLFLLLRTESVLGGNPGHLFAKILPAMLVGTAAGWCAASPYVDQLLSRIFG